ncbi:MerR family DNA-binding transcriptional regulator, partial [Alicyclobacillaceae bacterium I2511]
MLLSLEEAAKLLGVSKSTMRRWEEEGRIKPERTPGGHRRYRS